MKRFNLRLQGSKGFSTVLIIAILLIVVAIGLGGFFVWQKNRSDEAANKSNNQTSQNSQNKDEQPSDPHEGWKPYSNTAYGISFKYPADWKVDEASSESSPNSTTKQEYAINLKRNVEVKYNNTVSIEILDLSLDEAAAVHDRIFAQAPANKVTRSTDQLKGKQSVQYAIDNLAQTKLYLFGVGGKTYLFTSINEELNVQADADYWAKFGKVLDSMQITM